MQLSLLSIRQVRGLMASMFALGMFVLGSIPAADASTFSDLRQTCGEHAPHESLAISSISG